MRAYPIQDQTLRDQIAEYGTAKDTLNDALRKAISFADIALKSGFEPKTKFPRAGASLSLDPNVVENLKFIASAAVGHKLSFEQSLRVIILMAKEGKKLVQD